MRAPVVLGAFVFCSAACAQSLSSSTNAPAADASELRQNVRAEVQVGGNKGKALGHAKILRRKVPPPNVHGPKPPLPRPKPEPIERPTLQRNLREELAEQRANLRLEKAKLQIKDQVAATKELISERRRIQ